MAKFYGEIGFGKTVETSSGVYEDVIEARKYMGDILRNTRRWSQGEHLNNDLTVGNTISIVADAYAMNHFHEIRYISWSGANWTVSDVEVKHPRLELRLREVYNGPTAETPEPPGDDSEGEEGIFPTPD